MDGRSDAIRAEAAMLPDCLRWALVAPDLPQLTLALRVGERFQSAVLGTTKKWLGHVPLELNPHEGGRPALDHRHPFYLAEDADGDGRIDHVLLYAPRGLSPDWRQLLGEVRPAAAPQGDLPQLEATAQWLGNADGRALPCRLLGYSRVWRSVTPYVPNVHLKASKLTAPDALARELAQRGLPACGIQELSGYEAWGRHQQRNEFIIERPEASDPKARKSASGQRFAFRLTFAEAVRGPLALGFACHLGLGLFRREAPEAGVSD